MSGDDLKLLLQLTLETHELLRTTNSFLQALIFVTCMVFGSLLFVHFGRFMRW